MSSQGLPRCAPTSGGGCVRTSSPGSCWQPSWSPKAWPTPSWPGCHRSTVCTPPSPASSDTPSWGRRGSSCSDQTRPWGPLIFAAITPLVVAGDDPASAIALAGMLAILVGVIEVGLGAGKLGFVADLLSSEVQVGYMNGLAIVIIVGQLPKLSGFSTDADTFVDELREFVTNFDQRDTTALTLGLITLAVLLVLPRLTRRIPAVLVAVVGATVVAAVWDLDIATVGTLPKGLPSPAVPWTGISDVGPLL